MKIYLTVNAPALEAMIQDVYKSGTVASYSEAVNVLLRELLDCRKQTARPSANISTESSSILPADDADAPDTAEDSTERLDW